MSRTRRMVQQAWDAWRVLTGEYVASPRSVKPVITYNVYSTGTWTGTTTNYNWKPGDGQ